MRALSIAYQNSPQVIEKLDGEFSGAPGTGANGHGTAGNAENRISPSLNRVSTPGAMGW